MLSFPLNYLGEVQAFEDLEDRVSVTETAISHIKNTTTTYKNDAAGGIKGYNGNLNHLLRFEVDNNTLYIEVDAQDLYYVKLTKIT